LIRGRGRDHRLNRLLGVGLPPEREEAEGAVLFDGALIVGSARLGAQTVQQQQRILVCRRRVQVARHRERVVGPGGRDRDRDDCDRHHRAAPVHHGFLKSTLRRAGPVNVTVVA
jgi:hypothetical protein